VALAVALACGSGCSTPFGIAWKKAGEHPAPVGTVEGRWEGTWTSVPTGHTGALRCLVVPVGEGLYDMRYHATFWGVLNFAYRVQMIASPTNSGVRFSGSKDLGWLAGGEYTYEAWANPTNFQAGYKSKHDHGTFELRRPASKSVR
jgi:hypothetical protein